MLNDRLFLNLSLRLNINGIRLFDDDLSLGLGYYDDLRCLLLHTLFVCLRLDGNLNGFLRRARFYLDLLNNLRRVQFVRKPRLDELLLVLNDLSRSGNIFEGLRGLVVHNNLARAS